LFVSAGSVYEIADKRDRDKVLCRLPKDLPTIAPMLGFEWPPIEPDDALCAARWGHHHRDPWDRIIATRASRRSLDLITSAHLLTKACAGWTAPTLW